MPKPTKAQLLKGRRRLGDSASPHPFQLFRTDRLAQLFDVNESTIWRWRQNGVLPAFVEIGGIRGLTSEQVAQVLAQRREAANG